jgi:hypothetical protein
MPTHKLAWAHISQNVQQKIKLAKEVALAKEVKASQKMKERVDATKAKLVKKGVKVKDGQKMDKRLANQKGRAKKRHQVSYNMAVPSYDLHLRLSLSLAGLAADVGQPGGVCPPPGGGSSGLQEDRH